MKIIRAFSVPIILLAVLALGLQTASADKQAALTVETARAFVKKQVEAIKAGDLAAVKAGLSARQRDKVTADMLKKAKGETDKYKLEELVDKVEGMKIKMKNGRTLTTMISEGGGLVADTLWFK
jgi:phosphoglucomutase